MAEHENNDKVFMGTACLYELEQHGDWDAKTLCKLLRRLSKAAREGNWDIEHIIIRPMSEFSGYHAVAVATAQTEPQQ